MGAPQATLPIGERCCKKGSVGASNWATAGLIIRRDLSIEPVFWRICAGDMDALVHTVDTSWQVLSFLRVEV